MVLGCATLADPFAFHLEKIKPAFENSSELDLHGGLYLSVMAEGFEPSTACLEGRCSIQLSYATISRRKKF